MSSKPRVPKRNQSCGEFAVLGKVIAVADIMRTSCGDHAVSKTQRACNKSESSVGSSSSNSSLSPLLETQSYSGQLLL